MKGKTSMAKNGGNHQIIMAGVGGQGILFSTKIVSTAAMMKGYDVIGSETHGMSQRGGSVISHLKIGDFKSPLVRNGDADILFTFEQSELTRNLPFLEKGGQILLNANDKFSLPDSIKETITSQAITIHTIDANKEALKLKSPLIANLVVLGFCSSLNIIPITGDEFKDAIRAICPEKFLDLNIRAFEAGYGTE